MSLVEVFPQSPEQPDAPLSPSQDSGDPASKKNIVVLKNRSEGGFGPEQTIYLVGTFHLSKNSCEDVRQLIQAVKPQVKPLASTSGHLLHSSKHANQGSQRTPKYTGAGPLATSSFSL